MYPRHLLANTPRWTPVTAARTFSCSRNSSDWKPRNKCKSHPFAGLVPRRYACMQTEQTYCKTWVGRPVWERGYPSLQRGAVWGEILCVRATQLCQFSPESGTVIYGSVHRSCARWNPKLQDLTSIQVRVVSCINFQAWLYLLLYMYS